ncbi:MAG TPA: transaldolase [Kofleriaceae bacterium]|jgi:transaldolase
MNENPLLQLSALGQSIWMDYLDRGRIESGQVRRHIEQDGLRGMTSNPTIFEKAITSDHAYDAPIRELAQRGKTSLQIFETITLEDIRLAADEFRPVFERLDRRDGFVSLEVSPHLAYDTFATIEEARRLWRAVDRPNVMIKVPATAQGIPAIETLIAEGIQVNVTLLFGLDRYDEVAAAYLAGIEARVRRGESPRVASVASFFLSRIDTLVDAELDAREHARRIRPELAASLRGKTAIACARIAYQRYLRHFGDARATELARMGARPQRLLWASTSTKNPAYSDVYYVDALIGEDTIDTVPLETLEAYREHGHPARRIEDDVPRARAILRELTEQDIDLAAVARQLEREGVAKFVKSYDQLLEAIGRRRRAVVAPERRAGA